MAKKWSGDGSSSNGQLVIQLYHKLTSFVIAMFTSFFFFFKLRLLQDYVISDCDFVLLLVCCFDPPSVLKHLPVPLLFDLFCWC